MSYDSPNNNANKIILAILGILIVGAYIGFRVYVNRQKQELEERVLQRYLEKDYRSYKEQKEREDSIARAQKFHEMIKPIQR